jgi:hypothetical protein
MSANGTWKSRITRTIKIIMYQIDECDPGSGGFVYVIDVFGMRKKASAIERMMLLKYILRTYMDEWHGDTETR